MPCRTIDTSKWVFSVLGLLGVACACVNSPSTGYPGQSKASLPVSQGVPAAPAPVPPNASSVTATVLKQTVWPPGALIESRPAVANDRTHYSFTILISTVAPKEPKLESFATPGMNVEVFSLDRLEPELVGRRIQATLQLTGDTRAVRWWVSDIQTLK